MLDLEERYAFIDAAAAEHQRIRHQVGEVQQELAVALTAGFPASAARLLARLAELEATVARHFADEQEEGVLEEAACRRPGVGPRVEQLCRQHPVLLARLQALVDLLREGMTLSRLPDKFLERFTRFADDLRTHEQEENRLLEAAFGVSLETDPEQRPGRA